MPSDECSRGIEKERLLLVEGKDEQFFFEAFLQNLGITTIQIFPVGGKTQFKTGFNAIVAAPNFRSVVALGIIRDADKDSRAAFQSVCGVIKNHSYKKEIPLRAPDRPFAQAGRNPAISVFIMPDNKSEGMLEDLCIRSISGSKELTCIEDYFSCLEKNALGIPEQISKAKVHAFLASREEPDKRLGEAAKAGYWLFKHDAFTALKEFLQQLAK
jgi:hypothetical protein